jgi:hypothetical protein
MIDIKINNIFLFLYFLYIYGAYPTKESIQKASKEIYMSDKVLSVRM